MLHIDNLELARTHQQSDIANVLRPEEAKRRFGFFAHAIGSGLSLQTRARVRARVRDGMRHADGMDL